MDDAVLVRKLEQGEDPEMTQFDAVPIWVQYKGVPFYLLSKTLASDLGRRTGEYICIDNDARDDICDKILRARVWLPLARPLRPTIMVEDELSEDEVDVSLRYERLPNSCLFRGIIRHNKQDCNEPEFPKKSRYSASIGVQPTSYHDLRRWPIPERIGEIKKFPSMALTWRSERGAEEKETGKHEARNIATVSHVAMRVQQLTVQNNDDARTNATASTPAAPTAAMHAITNEELQLPASNNDTTNTNINNNTTTAATESGPKATSTTSSSSTTNKNKIDGTGDQQLKKTTATWKRKV
jgi:hypothetical protein